MAKIAVSKTAQKQYAQHTVQNMNSNSIFSLHCRLLCAAQKSQLSMHLVCVYNDCYRKSRHSSFQFIYLVFFFSRSNCSILQKHVAMTVQQCLFGVFQSKKQRKKNSH